MEKIIIHIHGDVHIHLGCDACEDFFNESDYAADEPEPTGFDQSEYGRSDEEPALVFCAFDDTHEPILEEKARKVRETAAVLFRIMEPNRKDHRKGAGYEGI